LTAALADEEAALAAVLGQAPPSGPPAQAPSPMPAATPGDPVPPPRIVALLAALGELDLLPEVPADVPELLRLLPHADLYVQDEVQVALHPTLTRSWQPRGRAGQRRVRAPGANQKCLGFGAADWRDGGLSFGFSPRRDAETFCRQLDDLVARSAARGRVAIVLADNARTHTPKGSRLVREALARHGDALRLVYTPAYDPESNPIERLWRRFRHRVTHNHHRDDFWALYADAEAEVDRLQADPQGVLQQLGSPSVLADHLDAAA
jgi:hypothetical protein